MRFSFLSALALVSMSCQPVAPSAARPMTAIVPLNCGDQGSLTYVGLDRVGDPALASTIPIDLVQPDFLASSVERNLRLGFCYSALTGATTLAQAVLLLPGSETVLVGADLEIVRGEGLDEIAFLDATRLDLYLRSRSHPEVGMRVRGRQDDRQPLVAAYPFDGVQAHGNAVVWGAANIKEPFGLEPCPFGRVEPLQISIATVTLEGTKCSMQGVGSSEVFTLIALSATDSNPELPAELRGRKVTLNPDDIAASIVFNTHHNWADSFYFKVSALDAEYADYQQDGYGTVPPAGIPRLRNAANYGGRGWKEY